MEICCGKWIRIRSEYSMIFILDVYVKTYVFSKPHQTPSTSSPATLAGLKRKHDDISSLIATNPAISISKVKRGRPNSVMAALQAEAAAKKGMKNGIAQRCKPILMDFFKSEHFFNFLASPPIYSHKPTRNGNRRNWVGGITLIKFGIANVNW